MTRPSPDASIPTPPASSVEYQSAYGTHLDRDSEHLKILSICWYVASGLAILLGCFPLLYVFMGVMFIVNPAGFGPGAAAGPAPPPPAAFIGWMFVIVGSAFTLLAWLSAALGFVTAYSLPKRRRPVVCYIAAALACLQVPIGTVLGIFTFIVLSRPSIKSTLS